ncbi:MAG: DegT/DnrJ/EryC1/StrS family aminotransferase [Oscillospiraceae bacterium]|nr:DegT/DnrJ/EryC1/StrS family aminotransferase [Oscillospiraceae bacterium]
MSKLALLGGEKFVTKDAGTIFDWPIVTKEDEEAVLDALRKRKMSGSDITKAFEEDWCKWTGSKYALGTNNGTSALHCAMFGCGVGRGDEIICPAVTYWASCTAVYNLGATVVFCDIDPITRNLDPKKLEAKITDKTKAIVVVHYESYPADMDEIMEIARKHNVKVIEDVSHAQGGKYKGRMLGTIGDVGAASLMSGKSFAMGEAGILHTDNREIYERAIAFGMYERFSAKDIETDYLKPLAGLPLGGFKFRMHQLSSAMGRVQIKYYDERCAEIDKAMNYFLDLIDGLPGMRPRRVDYSTGSTMAGWYATTGIYVPEELGGLSVTRFTEAIRAEGVEGGVTAGCNRPLHTHNLFKTADVFNDGKPTRIANSDKDVRELDNDLTVAEGIGRLTFHLPWFKHFDKELIEQYAGAFRKVCENYKDLLPGDEGDPENIGGWHRFTHDKKK